MSDNTLADDDTGSSINEAQAKATEKTYTQKDLDDMAAKIKHSISRKYEKMFEDLGDPEELRQLKTEAEKRRLDEQKKRGEFEKVIQELAERKDQEIKKRDEIIRNYTVDLPLVNAAAQFGSVNPDQVKALLKPRVRVGESGEPEVLDEKGSVKYNDKGQPYRVEDLVKEFLDSNTHFRAATPATTSGKSNIASSQEKLDLTKLDMRLPAHRQIYKEQVMGNKRR